MLRPFFGQQCAPGAEGCVSSGRRGFGFYVPAIRQRRQDGTVGGVFYGEGAAVARANFLIVDPRMVEDQVTAIELQHLMAPANDENTRNDLRARSQASY